MSDEKPAKKECKHDFEMREPYKCKKCGISGLQNSYKPLKKDELAERLHIAYLNACLSLSPDNYNQRAQVKYEQLNEQQKFLDRACADEARKYFKEKYGVVDV